MSNEYSAAWSDFWEQNRQGDSGGCLPEGWRGIDAAQQAVWAEFVRDLPRGARVLDIATGDGRVLRWMLKARPDLKAVGTDQAPDLPPAPKGAKLRAGVEMESLPFSVGRFAAVTSQFGFEYGDVGKTAAQIARVLAPGGRAGLLMHRGDGPILAHNLKRREQIRWALEERGLVDLAKRNLKARALGLVTMPAALSQAPHEGAHLHGEGSAAWEIAEAIRQTMVLGRRDHPANVARTLDEIAAKAGNELGRIASLEAACAQADRADELSGAFEAAGLEEVSCEPVREGPEAAPFATFRQFQRA